jgi:hypothetical protein
MSGSTRFRFAAISAVLLSSSAAILWLFWRFPKPSCIGCVMLLGCLLRYIHIAKWIDLAAGPDA